MRRQEEFYCSECNKYFLTYLRTNQIGNYTIECPSCGHHHYRVVENGLVTQQRHNEMYGTADILVGLKSTIKDTPWHDNPIFRRAQLRAYNGGISP